MSSFRRRPSVGKTDRTRPINAPRENNETPVFDAGKQPPVDRFARAGLSPSVNMTLSLKRGDHDRRPGTPVPFHEPDPDRVAKAEALRLRILAQEARHAAREADPVVRKSRAEWLRTGRPRTIPDMPDPDTSLCCSRETAAVKATRDGRTLYFANVKDAEHAFGAKPTQRRICNAISGILHDPYGWRWERLKNLRGGGGRAKTKGKM